MGRKKNDVSRRDFLKGAGLGALSMAAVGSLAASSVAVAGPVEAPGATGGSWRIPPAEVTDFVNEYTFDVVCVGHGYAGVTSCRELSEQGYKVALIEVQPEESYRAAGNESCGINSKTLDRLTAYNPVPHVDMMEYYENWMTIVGGQANPGLIMKFCTNNADNSDWYYDGLTDDDFATLRHTGWPNEGENWEHYLPGIGKIRFWPGTITGGQTTWQGYNREKAKALGAEFFFGTRGQYVIMDGGKVAGVVALTDDGYIKFNCKAAIICTGGFSENKEMLTELMPDISNNMTDTDYWKDAFMGERFGEGWSEENATYHGDGVKMAYWAGAHLETLIAGMNAKHIQPPGGMTNYPQSVWVRSNGKRFCDEFFPVVEQRGVVNVYMEREDVLCIFDDDFDYYRSFYVPQHGGAEPSESSLASLRGNMDKAYEKFLGTWVEPEGSGGQQQMMGPFAQPDFLCDDTLEGLADKLGLSSEAKAAFVEQIERYNGYCDQGVDLEFGRHKEVLFPVKKAPFYAATGNPGMGEVMCTCGGIITDAEQNALDHNFKPIPGLYVSGNDCGRRFGLEYVSPTPGVSLALAITLGRECGKSVAKFLA